MRGLNLLGMVAVASVALAPTMASAAQAVNPASSLSLASKVRAAPRAKRSSNLAGGALVLVVVAGAAAVAGVVAAADGGNSSSS
jgi:hypothetical protein